VRPLAAEPRTWLDFAEPGYVNAAISFWVVAEAWARGLKTDTRIHATDRASRCRFARYWRVIRPGSALIWRSWLRGAKARAERRPPESPRGSAHG
jgi:hypothetical protein